MCRDELLLKVAVLGLVSLDATPNHMATLLNCYRGAVHTERGAVVQLRCACTCCVVVCSDDWLSCCWTPRTNILPCSCVMLLALSADQPNLQQGSSKVEAVLALIKETAPQQDKR